MPRFLRTIMVTADETVCSRSQGIQASTSITQHIHCIVDFGEYPFQTQRSLRPLRLKIDLKAGAQGLCETITRPGNGIAEYQDIVAHDS